MGLWTKSSMCALLQQYIYIVQEWQTSKCPNLVTKQSCLGEVLESTGFTESYSFWINIQLHMTVWSNINSQYVYQISIEYHCQSKQIMLQLSKIISSSMKSNLLICTINVQYLIDFATEWYKINYITAEQLFHASFSHSSPHIHKVVWIPENIACVEFQSILLYDIPIYPVEISNWT